jgi:hypothetical protein
VNSDRAIVLIVCCENFLVEHEVSIIIIIIIITIIIIIIIITINHASTHSRH